MGYYGDIDGIDILFDEGNNDYLTFKIEEQPYDRNTANFYHAGGGKDHSKSLQYFTDYGVYFHKENGEYFVDNDTNRSYRYKDASWTKKIKFNRKEKREARYGVMETYLIIRIKNLSTTTTDKAKGRTLSE